MRFATRYGRLPAVSMPYHPPLFPAFQSAFYAVFGISVVAARLAIAIAVLASALLLYSLVLRTHRSPLLAATCIIVFFALPLAQWLAGEVMLEYLAAVFVFAAMYSLREIHIAFPLRRGLLFALFAGAAIWTKQTIFLALVPFVYVILSRRFELLRRKTIWISTPAAGHPCTHGRSTGSPLGATKRNRFLKQSELATSSQFVRFSPGSICRKAPCIGYRHAQRETMLSGAVVCLRASPQ